ncbi:MAG: hypothetical protein K2M56_06360 [Muribaculaceae bacterium]|nr:hypothetical protein [Muribaculaceae bacterium]
MISTSIYCDSHVAEYIRSKFYDPSVGAVRFPANLDVYHLLWDLLQKRPASASPIDAGNLVIALPDRREGKNPEYYNYLSARATKVLVGKLRQMMWAELHDFVDEGKHALGRQFKDSIFIFMTRYGIESISEDALWKNYQRWRYKIRRRSKRAYHHKSKNT